MCDECIAAHTRLFSGAGWQNARFRHALELIAYYEAQQDECAEAMRQVARKALGKDAD